MSIETTKITTGTVLSSLRVGVYSSRMGIGAIVNGGVEGIYASKIVIGMIVAPRPANARRRRAPIVN